ncbi:hypothetical protein [Flavobacterium lacus]|uniref:Uncharacterized protein n=1 Tax=Flavobacterium lacus TaxID=1353778 RepID=A0A328X0Q5_9FLAO|nr:hypothetical protein [Flavobacterium lacus]RAR48998.1 hypothetical protein B0I10_104137 [Flavobacterium lacus]
MKKFVFLIFLLSFFSCNKISESQVEVDAVQEVLNFYNGECKKSKGVSLVNGTKSNNYQLEISKSDLLNQDSKYLKFHSGNIAYLFYSNLNEEKANYDEIKVKINLSNGESHDYSYSDKELIEIESLLRKLIKIEKFIKEKDFESLSSEFDESLNVERKNIEDLFVTLENQYGKASSFQFQGFEFADSNNFGQLIVVKEVLMFEKVNATILLIFNRKTKNLIAIEFP